MQKHFPVFQTVVQATLGHALEDFYKPLTATTESIKY